MVMKNKTHSIENFRYVRFDSSSLFNFVCIISNDVHVACELLFCRRTRHTRLYHLGLEFCDTSLPWSTWFKCDSNVLICNVRWHWQCRNYMAVRTQSTFNFNLNVVHDVVDDKRAAQVREIKKIFIHAHEIHEKKNKNSVKVFSSVQQKWVEENRTDKNHTIFIVIVMNMARSCVQNNKH